MTCGGRISDVVAKADSSLTYLIGLDLGTSAIKGVLTDGCGRLLAEAGAGASFSHPHDGWVEVVPEQHYRNVCRVIHDLAAAAPGEVSAIAMAAASGNTLLTDEQGVPLTNIINWMDQRAEQQPPAALSGLTAAEVKQITGWPCVASFPLAHLAWLQENAQALYKAGGHYGMDTDWLLYRLTGKWRMDHSTATTFHLQEQTSGTYYEPFLKRLNIPLPKLSTLGHSGSAVGRLTAQALRDTGLSERTTVVAGSFDHPAAARSAGVLTPGQLLLSCGTSWVGFTPLMDRQAILDAQMLCDPFLSAGNGPWGGIFSVPCIGRTIDWYVDNLIASGERDRMRIFDESAAQASSGAGGLIIDLRAPPRRIEAERANLSRAVMESAARLLNEKITGLKAHGFQYDRAVMVGGPAKSPVWPEIVAEITGIEMDVGGHSAGARGAALLAGIGIGLYRDEYEAFRISNRPFQTTAA
ncbi:MAG: FGGY family carbohydrate kinase [bacterium]